MIAFAADAGEALVVGEPFEDDPRQLPLGYGELLARGEPLHLGQPLFDHLHFSGLHGKVRLGEGDGVFAGVAVLSDEVAGIARERDVFQFPLRS